MAPVVLRSGEQRAGVLVCIHPASGSVEPYRALAGALAWPGQVLGIAAPPPEERGYVLAELAEHYVAELDPQLPAQLAGWALGGVIAAEMSHIIAARRGRVQLVAIIDARAPQPEMRARPTDRAAMVRAFLQHVALTRELVPIAAPESTTPGALRDALRGLGADDGQDEAAVEQRFLVFASLVRALFHHTPRPVPIPIDLFEASESHPAHPKPPTLGWERVAPTVAHHTISGHHYSVLAPRHILAVAAAIDRRLENV